MNNYEFNDEILEIEYIGEQDTIDINTTGNRLFYANGILTHNSAVDEIEFDHSHIAGGLSKIQTADNVIGIFTSRAMKERGRYQIQFMKTRSSSGVGQKVDLEFNVDTLRITDLGEEEQTIKEMTKSVPTGVMSGLKRTSVVSTEVDPDTGEIVEAKSKQGYANRQNKISNAPLIRSMLDKLNPEKD